MEKISYSQAIDFLFKQLPVFQVQGPGAYKPGLQTTLELAEAFGNPHKKLKFVHVAGTNGKGSVAHSIASVLQVSGYETGLFTSPHLLDFRERIRINGGMIPREDVTGFLERYFAMNLDLKPTFFELTTVMALDWFARKGCDIAVMEVGLGGLLDSTNIITPEISIITNISLDHTALLGNTEEEIASQKAGIIKPGVPVVAGEVSEGVAKVIAAKAAEENAPLYFTQGNDLPYKSFRHVPDGIEYGTYKWGEITCSLSGDCQPVNAATVFKALDVLRALGYDKITIESVSKGLGDVQHLTGLMGRWYKISDRPLTFCDTGHNPGAWQWLAPRLAEFAPSLNVVLGFVGDKDVDSICRMLPKNARYYFTAPSVSRKLPAGSLAAKARSCGLTGDIWSSVAEAYEAAKADAIANNRTIFVGGSSFVVSNLLEHCDVVK